VVMVGGGDQAFGKMCAVATITPPGAHIVISNGWAFPQMCTRHTFRDGAITTPWFDIWQSDPVMTSSNLDNNDKLYLIDAPNINLLGRVIDSYEKYMNFYDYVTGKLKLAEDMLRKLIIYGIGKVDGNTARRLGSHLQN